MEVKATNRNIFLIFLFVAFVFGFGLYLFSDYSVIPLLILVFVFPVFGQVFKNKFPKAVWIQNIILTILVLISIYGLFYLSWSGIFIIYFAILFQLFANLYKELPQKVN